MKTEINPLNIRQEQPTEEAIKAAQMVSRYMYWMANRLNKESLIAIFGDILGEHYWSKIVYRRNEHGGNIYDTNFWFELDNENRQKLMHYLIGTGYKGK